MTTVKIGDNTTDGIAGCEATQIYKATPTTNLGSNSSIEASTFDSGDTRVSWLRFTGISSIPAGSTITAVSLFLWKTNDNVFADDGGSEVPNTFEIRRSLRDWVETQATWNIYKTSNNWGTAGGSNATDRSATLSGSQATAFNTDVGAYKEIALNATGIADVQGFLDGTLTNNGWRFGLADESGTGNSAGQYQVFTSDNGTNGHRPYLSVTYTAGGSNAVGRGLTESVLTARRSLVAMPRRGLVGIERPQLVGFEKRKIAA